MKQFKRVQVALLPTENENKGIYLNPILSVNKIHYWDKRISNFYIAQHLYIISDDEIKEGDWHLNADMNIVTKKIRYTLYKATKVKLDFIKKLQQNNSDCKFYKIIATTDTLLNNQCIRKDGTLTDNYSNKLPQPSQQFIEKYIEDYNKDSVIKDVLVEYEQDYANRNCSTCNLYTNGTCALELEKECCSNTKDDANHEDYWVSCLDDEEDSEIYKLKINPKYNTITIKQLTTK